MNLIYSAFGGSIIINQTGVSSVGLWQNVQATGTTTTPTTGPKAYVYTYDELSRLTNASFKEIASGNWHQTSKFKRAHQ